jgi:uncharacterized protein (DUF1501 family)
MGLSRRGLLGGGLAALVAGALPRTAAAAEDLRVVVMWCAGGWDATYIFDPHFSSSVIDGDATATLASVGGLPFADSEERPSVRAVFEAYASRSVIVNGISVGSISHQACSRRLLTGSREPDGADLCARVAASLGGGDPLPYLGLGGLSLPGSLGSTLLLDSAATTRILADSVASPTEDVVQAYLSGLTLAQGSRSRDWADSLARLPELQESADVLDPAVPLGDNAQVVKALAALDAELCRCVMLEPELPPQTQFDSHIDNHYNQTRVLEKTFADLKQLLDGLEASGSLDRTLVLVASEMGRTPVLNGGAGKDHWPYTSALLVGGGVRGGRVLGATDDTLSGRGLDRGTGEVDDGADRLSSADFVGSLLQHLGLDAQGELPGCSPVASL